MLGVCAVGDWGEMDGRIARIIISFGCRYKMEMVGTGIYLIARELHMSVSKL